MYWALYLLAITSQVQMDLNVHCADPVKAWRAGTLDASDAAVGPANNAQG